MDRGLVRLSGDSMSAFLGYNSLNWRDYASSNNVWHVAIVFGKLLVNDQVTLEYAARIRTLVELLLVKDEPLFRPSLIFFCGDTRRSLSFSNSSTDVATAGHAFFQELCKARNVNLEGIQITKDTTSKNEGEVVQFVTREVKKYLPTWFEQAATAAMEEVGTTTKSSFPKQTKVKVHFTFVSTAYHLSNFNDIHNRSPKQSCMKSIEKLQEDVTKSLAAVNRRAFLENYYYSREKKQSFASDSPTTSSYNKSSEEYFDECIDDICYYNEVEGHHQDDDTVESHDFEEEVEENDREFFQPSSFTNNNKQIPEVMRQGVLETSWSFQYATYPYIQSSDEVVAFLGSIFLLGEELVPLLVNMEGVVQKTEFFQRDNYLALASTRRSLVFHVEDLYLARKGLRRSLKSYFIEHGSAQSSSPSNYSKAVRLIEAILESALHSLGRCVDLVRPAGLFLHIVPKNDWEKALNALEHSISEIRNACDPDRPLSQTEW
eukprot:CAMPEP_0172422092 /NCGR_PEP_ID=MMETSP1064-20121228/8285_1 /TAXON_ID=202472 /ORGANISM="Aulacoseira subarctica , Strain CCAP 1002/5" /LENGTH=488 /DNA_ID=CAMNT_0013162797 /DNA_START=510 /DNA_END=1973 /DNA_ORIENTATION=-